MSRILLCYLGHIMNKKHNKYYLVYKLLKATLTCFTVTTLKSPVPKHSQDSGDGRHANQSDSDKTHNFTCTHAR